MLAHHGNLGTTFSSTGDRSAPKICMSGEILSHPMCLVFLVHSSSDKTRARYYKTPFICNDFIFLQIHKVIEMQ